jgi:hypothetical protein
MARFRLLEAIWHRAGGENDINRALFQTYFRP